MHTLKKLFLFQHCDDEDLNKIASVIFPKVIKLEEILQNVVESSEFDVGIEEKEKNMSLGFFGELALL